MFLIASMRIFFPYCIHKLMYQYTPLPICCLNVFIHSLWLACNLERHFFLHSHRKESVSVCVCVCVILYAKLFTQICSHRPN